MKVLWITNRPIAAGERKYNIKATSGTWMEPTLNEMKNHPEIKLSVATVANISVPDHMEEDEVEYYFLPKGKKAVYDYRSKKNIESWKRIIEKTSPDIIMIWGTEYAHGLCALRAAGKIPSVIMIQGIVDTVAKNYLGGMTREEIAASFTLRNLIKRDTLYRQQRFFEKKAVFEKEMIRLSGNLIIENEWAKCHCEELYDGCRTYYCPININSAFFSREWEWRECEKHTVFCSAPGYPIKGLHNLFRALALVKKKYPDVKLYVPGMNDPFSQNSFSGLIKRQSYTKFLMRLIDGLRLRENICFEGRLSSEQMAERMRKTNVFVVPSCVENQSNTLREAMAVGTPCIASYVGGIPEIVTSGENGLLYRYEEYPQLADFIVKIFSDSELAEKFSRTAKPQIEELVNVKTSVERLVEIYSSITGIR